MDILEQITENITNVQRLNKINWNRHKKAMKTIMSAIKEQLGDEDEVCMCPSDGAFTAFETDSDGYARFGPNHVLGSTDVTVSCNIRVLINVDDIACMVVVPIHYLDSTHNKKRTTTIDVDNHGTFVLDDNGIHFIVGHVFGCIEVAIRQRHNQKSLVHWYGL